MVQYRLVLLINNRGFNMKSRWASENEGQCLWCEKAAIIVIGGTYKACADHIVEADRQLANELAHLHPNG